MNNLENEVLLVTGGGGGIGTEVCRLMASVGATIVSVEHEGGPVIKAPVAHTLTADLADITEWEEVTEIVLDLFGRIDGLVHCVGTLIPGTLLSLSSAEIRKMIGGNFLSYLYGIRAVAPVMIRQGRGRIITVGSLGGIVPMPYEALYSAAKFAVRGLSLSVGEELRAQGVSVSLISAGSVETSMLDREADDEDSFQAFLTRPLRAADIAQAVLHMFLKPRPEVRLPRVTGISSSLISLAPRFFSLVYRLLRPIGNRRRRNYLRRRAVHACHQTEVNS